MEQYENSQIYELIKKAQNGDVSAKEKLTRDNLKLVYSIANRFIGRGYDIEELNQVGSIGLLRAIEKFDVSFGVKFSTYAVPLILGEIKRFLRDDGPIKVSRSLKHTASETARVIEDVQKTEGRCPGVLEISKIIGVAPEEIVQAREAVAPTESFSSLRGDTNKTLADILPSKENENDMLEKLDLKTAIKNLKERDKSIIVMRYFLEKTQSDVAKKLGISQVQVSRLEKRILEEFKKNLSYKG